MPGLADANLVLAAIAPDDALHARAVRHLGEREPLVVPFSVGIELLHVSKRRGVPLSSLLVTVAERFILEREDVLFTAAEAVDAGDVPTVFDAVHLADAWSRGEPLHTADARLHRSPFPTVPF